MPSKCNIKLPDTFGNSKKVWMKLFFCAVFVWPLWILELRFVRSVPNLPCHAISGWWLQCNSCLWCLLPPKQRICWYCQLFPHKSKCIQMSRRPTREHWKNFQVLAMTMMPEITIYISFRKWSGWGRGWCSTGVKRIFTCLVQKVYFTPPWFQCMCWMIHIFWLPYDNICCFKSYCVIAKKPPE